MNSEERLLDLDDRIHNLEMLDELDRQLAKTERDGRRARKREINVERKTLRVRQEELVYALAEDVTDPIKWNALIRDGLLYRLNDGWYVRTDVATVQGYEVVLEDSRLK